MYCMNSMMFLNHHVEQHVLYEQHDGPRPLSIVWFTWTTSILVFSMMWTSWANWTLIQKLALDFCTYTWVFWIFINWLRLYGQIDVCDATTCEAQTCHWAWLRWSACKQQMHVRYKIQVKWGIKELGNGNEKN